MMTVQTILTAWRDLLDSVNYETMLPKFPERATKCVRELASIARVQTDFPKKSDIILHELSDTDAPELIFYEALKKTARCDDFSTACEFLPYMPLLEDALDAQRRCRVCGCTDYNACICGCSWVAGDLCSECWNQLKEGEENGKQRSGRPSQSQAGDRS